MFGSGDLYWYGSDTSLYRERYELKTNEEKNDWSDLVTFIDKLNNLPSTVFSQEIEKYVNVDRALWYIAYCNLFVNLDSYLGSGHNYYIYNDPSTNQFNMIPWDINEILGTFSQGLTIQQREQLSTFYKENDVFRPLVRRLLSISEYRERYLAHLRVMLLETATQEFWTPRIRKYQDLIRADVYADTKKLYSNSAFETNVNASFNAGGTIPGILPFLNNRTAFLKNEPTVQRVSPSIVRVSIPSSVQPGQTVTVTATIQGASSARLFVSVNQQRFTPTRLTAGNDTTFVGTIAGFSAGILTRYYVEAATASGTVSYAPLRAEKETFNYRIAGTLSSPVVINELLASNRATLRDPQGHYDDWIELYNLTDDTVDLSGKYLADELAKPKQWKIPAGTTIFPRGYLLVWADDDTAHTPGLHANFKLAKSGEGVFFFESDAGGNGLLDSVTFGLQQDDISWARVPDGVGSFQFLTPPTPLRENSILTSVVEPSQLPTAFSLEQNFPNPFNPTTTMKFQVSGFRFVSLIIFDVLGREVATLVNGELNAGEHSVVFSAKHLSSGVYFYRLTTPTFSQTKLMEVIK